MRKIFIYIFLILYFLLPKKLVFAEKIAGQSALISYNLTYKDNFNTLKYEWLIKQLTIRKILDSYHSPLVDESNTFVKICQNYQIDCYLLPAIAGLESSFGQYIFPGSYNPFGWGGGYIIFKNWTEAIDEVGWSLRQNYYNQGADTVEKIAPIYAESKTWSERVNYFRNLFLEEEKKQKDLFILENSIK